MDLQLCVHETIAIIFHCGLASLSRKFGSLFDTVLGNYGIICDGVGLWSGFNKGGSGIGDIDICLGDVIEVTGTKNQVAPSHGAPIGSSVIIFHGGRIP